MSVFHSALTLVSTVTVLPPISVRVRMVISDTNLTRIHVFLGVLLGARMENVLVLLIVSVMRVL